MGRTRHRLLVAAGLALLAAAPPVFAGGLLIAPVVIEMDSPRRAVAIRVTNGDDSPVTLQTDAFTWTQVEGQDRNEPTDDLLMVPPIAKVPPGATQIFRLMLRAPVPAPVERSYHVVLEDVTQEQAPKDGQALVAFKLTHRLPVMVAPAGKITTTLRWKPCMTAVTSSADPASATKTTGGDACVRLRNAGNRRVRLETLTLAGDGWKQSLPLKSGINMLASTEREWKIPLAPGQTGAPRGVQVQTGRGETLQAEAGGF